MTCPTASKDTATCSISAFPPVLGPHVQTFLTLEADLTELRAFSWLAVLMEERLTAQQMDEILIWVSHDLYK